jgi:hypothetical protein
MGNSCMHHGSTDLYIREYKETKRSKWVLSITNLWVLIYPVTLVLFLGKWLRTSTPIRRPLLYFFFF